MDECTTTRRSRIEQCRKNAREKSQKKRQQTLVALGELQKERKPISLVTVAKRARVSLPFLRNHPDLVQRIEEAARSQDTATHQDDREAQVTNQVLSAMRRRLEEMKGIIAKREAELRQRDGEIAILFGKLASRSALSEAEIREMMDGFTRRLYSSES
jgi:hypothetical protein